MTYLSGCSSPGGGISEYLVAIWAEENSALGAANQYEWAFGNGANTPAAGGVVIYVPGDFSCEIVAMSAHIGGGTPSATIEAVLNGTPQGAAANVVLSSTADSVNELGTPVAVSSGDRIGFRTTSSSGTAGPCTVTAWLRYYQ